MKNCEFVLGMAMRTLLALAVVAAATALAALGVLSGEAVTAIYGAALGATAAAGGVALGGRNNSRNRKSQGPDDGSA